jgi:hypothetical protein
MFSKDNQRVWQSTLPVGRTRPKWMDERCPALLRSEVPLFRIYMAEASNYYVTVSVDHCIIPGAVMIRAANKDAAAQRAEMKVALQIRDAITVRATDVREG